MVPQWVLLLAATTSNVATQYATASAGTARAWAAAPPPGTHSCARNNVTRFGPMGCGGSDDQHGHACCKLNQQDFHCAADTGCNVCPWCCHDSLKDPHSCSSCVAQHCDENLAKLGCSPTANSTGCCPQAQQNASTTLKNVLLIGDSVTNGMSASVAGKLKNVALVQKYIGNDAAGEALCWEVGSASPMGETIKFDVIAVAACEYICRTRHLVSSASKLYAPHHADAAAGQAYLRDNDPVPAAKVPQPMQARQPRARSMQRRRGEE